VIRIGALIGFADAAQPFILTGSLALAAGGLAGLADAAIVVLDPPDDRAASFATIVRGAPTVPLAAKSVRGVVLDGAWATDARRVASAVSALVPRGRLVAPADMPVPPGVRELARDDRQWVAERDADVISLRRAPGA
jgi:hypothetical protein